MTIFLDKCNHIGYNTSHDQIFYPQRSGRFFDDGTRKGIQTKYVSKIEAILDRLDAANEVIYLRQSRRLECMNRSKRI